MQSISPLFGGCCCRVLGRRWMRRSLSSNPVSVHPEKGLNMLTTKVIGLTIALATGGLVLTTGSAFAGCNVISLGVAMDNPEQDTIGLVCDPERTGSVGGTIAASQRSIAQIGGATGDPEKDTFGYVSAPAE
jgi:hypothetical protein